jgi:hypothetical protein
MKRFLVASGAALVVASTVALGASFLGSAKGAWNNPVVFKNGTCSLTYSSVSSSSSEVVFGVFNQGTVSHRFFIGGPYATPWIKPGEESTLVTNFSPGRYKWACVSRRIVMRRGVFTMNP